MPLVNWQHFFNDEAKRRLLSKIRTMADLINREDVINMCGGIPNSLLFPIETATFKLSDGTHLKLDQSDMERAQQYAGSLGFPELIDIVEKLIFSDHNPPLKEQRRICIACGNQDTLHKCFRLFVSTGDPIIISENVYEGALSALNPLMARYVCVEEDQDGLNPASLRKQLESWKKNPTSGPKVMYVVTIGSNPTGTVTTLERKKEIYKLAQEYNFIIIEDEPYIYLNYEEEPTQSFLSLDTDGRVIHLQSFSKVIAAGFRLGFVCAPLEVINKLNSLIQCTTQQAPSFSQMVMLKLLQSWGEDGLRQHIIKIRQFYKKQRDCALASTKKWLTGLAEWTEPKGGLFLWIKLLKIHDTYELGHKMLSDGGVGIIPGKYFAAGKSHSPYIRLAFSCCSPEEMDEGLRRLAVHIRHETDSIHTNGTDK